MDVSAEENLACSKMTECLTEGQREAQREEEGQKVGDKTIGGGGEVGDTEGCCSPTGVGFGIGKYRKLSVVGDCKWSEA